MTDLAERGSPPGNVVTLAAMEAFRACELEYPRTTVVADIVMEWMTLLTTFFDQGYAATRLSADVFYRFNFLTIRDHVSAPEH